MSGIIEDKGKASDPSNQYLFGGSFQKGTHPTLLDSKEAQRVKRFIENLVFRAMFKIRTGTPDKSLIRLNVSDPTQTVWELDLRTALECDPDPHLGDDLKLDGFGIRAMSPGGSGKGPFFYQYGGDGFTIVPENWPAATTDSGKIRLAYGAYTAGFQAPELTSASVNLLLPTTEDVGDAILMSAISGEMGWSEITGGAGITVSRSGRDFEIEITDGGAPVDAQYVTLATNSTLTEERVLTAGTGIAITDAGAGSTVTVDLDDTAVTPDTYGDASNVAQITVDQQGRITDVTDVAISGGGGAPTDATYVCISTDATLTDERVLTAGTGITITDGGAGSTITIENSGSGTGTVTSVELDGAATGLTFGGDNPITTSGTIELGGILAADYGGTGFDAFDVGDILYADSTTTLAKLTIGNDGEVLTVSTDVPSWSAAAAGSLTVEEQDGSPTVSDVSTIKVTNGSLTDDGGGTISLDFGGAGSLTVEEQDGSPTVSDVTTIKVTNDKLTDDGGGTISLDLTGDTVFPLTGDENDFVTLDSGGDPQRTQNMICIGADDGLTKLIGFKNFQTTVDQYSLGMFATPSSSDPQYAKEGLTVWQGDESTKEHAALSVYARTLGALNINQVSIGHDVHFDDQNRNGLSVYPRIEVCVTDPDSGDDYYGSITAPGSESTGGVLQLPSDSSNLAATPVRRVLMEVCTDPATLESEVKWGDCIVADGVRNATYSSYDTGLWAGTSGDETALGNGDNINVVAGSDISVSRSGGVWTITNDSPGSGATGTVTSVAGAGTSGITVTGSPITTSGTLTVDLDDTAVTPDTYGSATNVAQITVDQQGRITSATEVAIAGGGGGAPTDAQYVTLATDATLTDERVLTAGTGITITDGGAGGAVTITSTAGGAPSDASYVVIGADATLTDERVLTAGTGITITDGGAGGNITIEASGGGGGMSSFNCSNGAESFEIDSSNNTLTFSTEFGSPFSWNLDVGGTVKLEMEADAFMEKFSFTDGGANYFDVENNDTVSVESSDGFVFIDCSFEDIIDITDGMSDESVKDNIEPVQGAWEKLQKLRAVEFDWNENAPKETEFCKARTGGTRDFGFVAQEVEKVLPEIVGTRRDGKKTIKYSRLTPLLLDTIQELKAEVKDLTERLEVMEHSQQ